MILSRRSNKSFEHVHEYIEYIVTLYYCTFVKEKTQKISGQNRACCTTKTTPQAYVARSSKTKLLRTSPQRYMHGSGESRGCKGCPPFKIFQHRKHKR